ncbi:MAG: amidohydrolase [Deltaproteobacteria bacterium]|nr:amidohydrolase [Deltaproteobacteria bacterium]
MEDASSLVDLKIVNGTVLTMSTAGEILERGTVSVHNGSIHGVTSEAGDLPARKVIDAKGKLVMPGLVNTHTHSPMSCFRGLSDDLPLMEWLEKHIFPAEGLFVDSGLAYWGSMLSCLEMMLSGTTTFADGYFFEENVAQAVLDSGLRAVVCQGVVDFPAPGVPDPSENVRRAVQLIREWGNRNSRVRCGIFAHSTYTCSPETLSRAKAAANEHEALLFIHLSETRDEIKQIEERFGCTPVRHLENLGIMDHRTVGVHCVWLTDEDMDLIARRDMGVSYTPESEMKLASGVAPIPELIRRGVAVSLGTDGPASNNDMDMFTEMDVSAKLQKVHNLDPTCASARETVWMATLGGARVLGMENEVGSIEPGGSFIWIVQKS